MSDWPTSGYYNPTYMEPMWEARQRALYLHEEPLFWLVGATYMWGLQAPQMTALFGIPAHRVPKLNGFVLVVR